MEEGGGREGEEVTVEKQRGGGAGRKRDVKGTKQRRKNKNGRERKEERDGERRT